MQATHTYLTFDHRSSKVNARYTHSVMFSCYGHTEAN